MQKLIEIIYFRMLYKMSIKYDHFRKLKFRLTDEDYPKKNAKLFLYTSEIANSLQIGGAKKSFQKGGNNNSVGNKANPIICEGLVNIKSPEKELLTNNEKKHSKCAPTKTFTGGTCNSFDNMIALVHAWNKFCEKNKQEGGDYLAEKKGLIIEPIIYNWDPNWTESDRNHYKKKLVIELEKRLANVCKNQLCWIKQEFIKEIDDEAIKFDLKFNTFRPPAPKGEGRFTWLGTTNIDQVLGQYELKYKDFKYLGTMPVDFDDIAERLAINVRDLNYEMLYNNGIRKLGAVFNLDPHYKDGSHWVAMFVDFNEGTVEFFDSAKGNPPKRIRVFMDRIALFIEKKLNKSSKILINNIRHQKKRTECGVYAISFILRRAEGKPFEEITKNPTDDETINQCRDIYFR